MYLRVSESSEDREGHCRQQEGQIGAPGDISLKDSQFFCDQEAWRAGPGEPQNSETYQLDEAVVRVQIPVDDAHGVQVGLKQKSELRPMARKPTTRGLRIWAIELALRPGQPHPPSEPNPDSRAQAPQPSLPCPNTNRKPKAAWASSLPAAASCPSSVGRPQPSGCSKLSLLSPEIASCPGPWLLHVPNPFTHLRRSGTCEVSTPGSLIPVTGFSYPGSFLPVSGHQRAPPEPAGPVFRTFPFPETQHTPCSLHFDLSFFLTKCFQTGLFAISPSRPPSLALVTL